MGMKIKLIEFNPQLAPSAAHAGALGAAVARCTWTLHTWNEQPPLEAIATALKLNLGPDWFVYQGGHHVAVHASQESKAPRLAMFGEV